MAFTMHFNLYTDWNMQNDRFFIQIFKKKKKIFWHSQPLTTISEPQKLSLIHVIEWQQILDLLRSSRAIELSVSLIWTAFMSRWKNSKTRSFAENLAEFVFTLLVKFILFFGNMNCSLSEFNSVLGKWTLVSLYLKIKWSHRTAPDFPLLKLFFARIMPDNVILDQKKSHFINFEYFHFL